MSNLPVNMPSVEKKDFWGGGGKKTCIIISNLTVLSDTQIADKLWGECESVLSTSLFKST